jgi:hypothetical protein
MSKIQCTGILVSKFVFNAVRYMLRYDALGLPLFNTTQKFDSLFDTRKVCVPYLTLNLDSFPFMALPSLLFVSTVSLVFVGPVYPCHQSIWNTGRKEQLEDRQDGAARAAPVLKGTTMTQVRDGRRRDDMRAIRRRSKAAARSTGASRHQRGPRIQCL